WPKHFPEVEEMVRAGFYFTGDEDSTACVTCGICLKHWKPSDKPLDEHRKASPYCELLKHMM
ncbi:baculoviral IAP repeat-containing protein, partial [Klebsiella pneumoniae]|uniref:baculoviral IAP repeat-containing protein n=1 Tax=Klebsiella pneumoniae TaxID=573 RepID=UPI0011799A94